MKVIEAKLKYKNVGNSLDIADSVIKPKPLPAPIALCSGKQVFIKSC